MYEKFFGLKENPFSIAPDPRYLYMSERHRDALAHLLFGIEREGGVVVLTGEVGTGKTTLCRYFLQRLPENVEIAFILHPRLTARELLAAICDEFGIEIFGPANTKALVDGIHEFLLKKHAKGIHLALLIDEAQNLSPDVLEQLRLLTNLETDRKKLLQIVLLGQPELRDLLAQDNLRQLAQRVTARYHLDALEPVDVRAYLAFRLSVAGCAQPLFTDGAVRKLYKLSQGIPRLINLIADRALLGAYSEHQHQVTADIVKRASREVGFLAFQNDDSFLKTHMSALKAAAGGLAVGLVMILVIALALNIRKDPPSVPEATSLATQGAAPEVEAATLPVQEASTGLANEPVSAAVPETAPVKVSTAPAAEPVLADDNEWSDSRMMERSASRLARYVPKEDNTFEAYKSLLQRWGVPPLTDRKRLACEYAELQGLKCLHRQGNWRSLIQLDRPAVLRLLNDQGQAFLITLTRLDTLGRADIELDGRAMPVELKELDRRWEGDYSLLYRLPPYQSPVIRPGAIQDEGLWLNQQLDTIRTRLLQEGGAEARNLPAYGASLTERVRWFQGLAGLEQDGVPGAMTLISLNSWLDIGGPRLAQSAMGGP